MGMAIFTLAVLAIYTVVRFALHKLAGIYMLKRLLLALFLALSYQNTLYLLPILLIELAFIILRFIFEVPDQKFNKITIVAEEVVFGLSYILLFLSVDAGVNSLIISIVVFIFIVYLAYDLTTIYLESRNEFPYEDLENDFEEMERKKR